MMWQKVFPIVQCKSNVRPRRRWRAVVIAMGLLISIVVFVFGVKALQIGKMMSTKMVMPPTTVSSAVVKEEDWAPTLSAIGSISAVQGAVVSTELGGVVAEIDFQNGGVAKKGDVLMRLDSSAEEAQLHTAQADLELAKANLERERDLAARKVVSKQEFDAAQSTFGQKQGAVDNMRSFITKKQVRAPFDGQARYSAGERWADDQLRSASGAADCTRPGLCRFRIAAAEHSTACHRI